MSKDREEDVQELEGELDGRPSNLDDRSTGISEEDRVAQLESELNSAKETVLRRTAELDNMRRRFAQEREQLIVEGNKRLITDLLDTVDNLERTLEHADKKSPLYAGVELVYKNFLKTLERYGVRQVKTMGTPFDVHKHDALMEEPRSEVRPGTVIQEIQKGYEMNDSVLRHAKVIVSKDMDND